jgi:hypothetical protein
MYEIIRTFSPIFRGLNFENPRAAAAYYVNLIINFPTSFQGILNEAQAIYGNNINRQALYVGRKELQKRGIIGKIYLTEESDIDFDRETFLPANPDIIWQENQKLTNEYWKQPEEMAFRKAKVKELYEHYRRNFKKYGIGIETGSLTGLFNIYWMHRKGIDTINYSCRDTIKTDIMTNNLEFYIVPDYLEYHIEALRRGLTQRVIFDDSIRTLFDRNAKRRILKDEEAALNEYRPTIEQRLAKYIEFSRNFQDQMVIKYTPIAYTTSRRSILYNKKGPFWACDFRRVLSHDPKEPQYYLGTIYLQDDLIEHIRENFEDAWANGVVVDDE